MKEIKSTIGEDGIGKYISLGPDEGIWFNDNMVLAMLLAIVSAMENIMSQDYGFANQFAAIAEAIYEKIKENQPDLS